MRQQVWSQLWWVYHVMFRISNINHQIFSPETSLHEASAIMITAPTIVSMTKNMHILRNARVQSQCTVLVKTKANWHKPHCETAKTS